MAKPDRLLRLMALMRALPAPVTAARLAAEAEVSLRTLYRDIAALRASGARIEGEAGFGYTLAEDPALPPQMFTRLEVEAVMMGLGMVSQQGDPELARAAQEAQGKLVASLPERVQREALAAVLKVYRRVVPEFAPGSDLIRTACWDEVALDLRYRDAEGRESARRIWPLALAYLEDCQMLLAFCCLRQDFRKFRLERVLSVARSAESFRPRRVGLLRDMVAQMASGH